MQKQNESPSQQISALRQIDEDLGNENVPPNVIEAMARQTTNLSSRETLFQYLLGRINHA